jgi:hypothetical protein
MVSKGYFQEGGFYFDDGRLLLTNNEAEATYQPGDLISWRLFSFPASERLMLEIKPEADSSFPLEKSFYSALGEIIYGEKQPSPATF